MWLILEEIEVMEMGVKDLREFQLTDNCLWKDIVSGEGEWR